MDLEADALPIEPPRPPPSTSECRGHRVLLFIRQWRTYVGVFARTSGTRSSTGYHRLNAGATKSSCSKAMSVHVWVFLKDVGCNSEQNRSSSSECWGHQVQLQHGNISTCVGVFLRTSGTENNTGHHRLNAGVIKSSCSKAMSVHVWVPSPRTSGTETNTGHHRLSVGLKWVFLQGMSGT